MDSDSNDEEKLNSGSETSDRAADSRSRRGPTIAPRLKKGKTLIRYNKRGVPTGDGATKLSTFEGMVGRTMVPITYTRWLDVPADIKEDIWQYVLTQFKVNSKSRKQVLQSVGNKWRNFKYNLNKNFIKPFKDDPKAANLVNPPVMYPFITKQDWKLFVSQKTSKKWEEQSKKAKDLRALNKYNHRLSRKGYSGLVAKIMEETGKTEEEISRAMLWKRARELKTGGYDSDVEEVVKKIVGRGKTEYTDADLDGIREEWSSYVSNFIYM